MKALQLAALALAAIAMAPLASAQGADRVLRIEAPADKLDGPEVKILGALPTRPTYDESISKWEVPLEMPGAAFATTYVVKSNEPTIVAVRLTIPTRVIDSNPLVYMPPPSVTSVDEKSMRELWETSDVFRSPSDERVQFRNLQDLLFINATLMKRDAGARRVTAMNVRAAFLLLQVVRNLGEKSWFIVDPSTKTVVDYADAILSASEAKGKSCGWLGPAACAKNGVGKLISAVRYSEATQLNRMYELLVPASLTREPNRCSKQLANNMRDFLTFLHAADAQGASSAISEGRVLQDIAYCESRLALCRPHTSDEAIELLSRLDTLLEQFNNPQTQVRRVEVGNAIEDLRAGHPAICPSK